MFNFFDSFNKTEAFRRANRIQIKLYNIYAARSWAGMAFAALSSHLSRHSVGEVQKSLPGTFPELIII